MFTPCTATPVCGAAGAWPGRVLEAAWRWARGKQRRGGASSSRSTEGLSEAAEQSLSGDGAGPGLGDPAPSLPARCPSPAHRYAPPLPQTHWHNHHHDAASVARTGYTRAVGATVVLPHRTPSPPLAHMPSAGAACLS